MVKNTVKICRKFIHHKINKNIKRKLGVKCFANEMMSLASATNLMTSLKLTKTPKNFVQRFFLHKINKNVS